MQKVLRREDIIRIQELANNAWPAEENFLFKGWILRFTDGATSRANSVLTLKYWGNNLEEDIRFVEEAYLRVHNLPTKFMLHDYHAPSGLDSKLLELGYQTEPIVDIMGMELKNFGKKSTKIHYQLFNSSKRTQKWSKAFARLAANRSKEEIPVMLRIMDRIKVPKKKYFAIVSESQIIGIILGVLQNGYLGIMDLIVDPNHRRVGVASALLNQAVEWARNQGGTHIYLQVEKNNHDAIALYKKLSFSKWFSYFYMTKR